MHPPGNDFSCPVEVALEDLANLIGLVCRGEGGVIGIGKDVMAGVRAHAAMNTTDKRTYQLAAQLLAHPVNQGLGVVGS